MAKAKRSPSELRAMFGANLRTLAADYASISDLSRQLEINRTQFNRYLSGESFPRPDVLDRICTFFGVDARVLLEPVSQIQSRRDPINTPFLRDYVAAGIGDVSEMLFPNGFYRFARRSFVKEDVYFVGLLHVRRDGETTVARGYESKDAMQLQDLPTDAATREYRGLVMRQENGLVLLAARKNAMTASFNFLSKVASFEDNYWVGYTTRTVPETVDGLRVTRLSFEFVGTSLKKVLPAARTVGFCKEEDLPPFHRRQLNPGVPFS
ncbi:MAG: helix-turn-helix transcriptional regulator [Sulfitobacter sp.]|nr:helix-turn-helix transcriptional regulator [Sulfitobacter sp.]